MTGEAGPVAMVVTDLDGTLLDDHGRLGDRNRDTLRTLGKQRVLRVVATGRSLYSALRVLDGRTPIDYLVFSSGAGVVSWPRRELLRARDLDAVQAVEGARALHLAGLDHMLHAATPENHRFWFQASGGGNPDFHARVSRYSEHAAPWPEAGPGPGPFSQLLAIVGATAAPPLQRVREWLAPLHVVRTTSPLDHVSVWFEVFPRGVSKADGAHWLLERHGLAKEQVLAIGNDYNDEDLLGWAHQPRVVANAPAPLRERYPVVASNVEDGFSDAVGAWWRRFAC